MNSIENKFDEIVNAVNNFDNKVISLDKRIRDEDWKLPINELGMMLRSDENTFNQPLQELMKPYLDGVTNFETYIQEVPYEDVKSASSELFQEYKSLYSLIKEFYYLKLLRHLQSNSYNIDELQRYNNNFA